MIAQTSWPDVGMAFVEHVLAPLIVTLGAAVVYWIKFRSLEQKVDRTSTAAKAAAVTSVEAVKASLTNTVKLSEVKAALEDNTDKTVQAAAAGTEAADKASVAIEAVHQLVNSDRESLEKRLKESEQQVVELKRQLEGK